MHPHVQSITVLTEPYHTLQNFIYTMLQASISCSGPNTPVQLMLSQELQR